MPVVVKNLLIINGLFFLATISLETAYRIDLFQKLGLFMPGSPNFQPYQFVSHMFMHANFNHIFFNMFALWMFGTAIENLMGSRRFLIYYMITGFGAAFLHLGVNYIELLSLRNELLNAGLSPQELRQYVESPPEPSGQTLPAPWLVTSANSSYPPWELPEPCLASCWPLACSSPTAISTCSLQFPSRPSTL